MISQQEYRQAFDDAHYANWKVQLKSVHRLISGPLVANAEVIHMSEINANAEMARKRVVEEVWPDRER